MRNLELVLTKELYRCYYFQSMLEFLRHVFSYPFQGRNRHMVVWSYNQRGYMPAKYL